MNRRLLAIELRRARLIERAAREREDLVQSLQSWAKPLGVIDRCVNAVRYLISHPPLVAGAVLMFTLLRPRSAFKWARRAWAVWRGYRWLTQKAAV